MSDSNTLLAEKAPLLLDYVRTAGDQLAKGDYHPSTASWNTADAEAKLVLLQQNYNNLVANAIPTLGRFVEETTTTVNLDVYGPWYVAVFCLFWRQHRGMQDVRKRGVN
jgi:hypothetical protein